MKQKLATIISLVALAFIMMLASCAPISDGVGGSGTTSSGGKNSQITIRLPPIGSSAIRALDAAQVSRLQRETAKYRVTFSGAGQTITREGNGTTYSATFPVGVQVGVTVYCLNANGEVIVKTVTKNITISTGANSLSFKLSEDGTEIIPERDDGGDVPGGGTGGGSGDDENPDDEDSDDEDETPDPHPQPPPPVTGKVTYHKGNVLGDVQDVPEDDKTYNVGDNFEVLDGANMIWPYGTFTTWTASTALEPADGGQPTNAPIPGSNYKMPGSGVTLTANWNAKEYGINYNFAIPSGGAQGNAQADASGATVFTMAGDDNDDALSTYTDTTGNWEFGGWSTTNGGARNITSKANIRSAVLAGDLTPASSPAGGGDSITLYAVWADARTPFDVTVNATAIGLGTTTISNVMNGNDITQEVTQYLTGQSNTTKKYELKAGNTFTANAANKTITLDSTNVTTKVAVTLGNQLIDATGNAPINDSALTVNFTDPSSENATNGKWYEVGTSLPTVSLGGNNAQQYAVGNGWRTVSSTTPQTQITEAMAGETLYPIGEQKVAVTVSSTANYSLNGTTTFYASKSADITAQVKVCMPTSATTASNGAKKYTWKVADSGVIDAGTGTAKTVDIDQYLTEESAFGVQVRFDSGNLGNVIYAFNGDDITDQIKTIVDANTLEKGNNNYTWNTADSSTITASSLTTTYDLDNSSHLKLYAVKITLGDKVIEASGSPIEDNNLTITNAGTGWYAIGGNLPMANLFGSSAAQYDQEFYWRTATDTTQHGTVTADMAGQTLYPIVRKLTYTITIEHYKWVGSSWEKIDDSDVSGYDLNPAPPLPDPIDYGCEISSSLLMGMTAIRIEDQQGSANQYSCDGNAAFLSANGAAINDLPADGSYATQISPGHTITSDITLYILWK